MMVKAQEKMWPKSCKIDWISFLNRQTTLNSGTTPDPDTIQEWENSQLPTGTSTLSCPVPALPGCLLLAALGSRTLGQGHSKGNLQDSSYSSTCVVFRYLSIHLALGLYIYLQYLHRNQDEKQDKQPYSNLNLIGKLICLILEYIEQRDTLTWHFVYLFFSTVCTQSSIQIWLL